jgi:SAM-dependent methyltransferase
MRMSGNTHTNALQEMTAAQRIVQVLDHLGIEKAHFAAHVSEDWSELVWAHSHRICSLTLVCPGPFDVETLQALAARLLLISGDQPPYGERMTQALARLPAAQHLALVGYTNVTWNDPIADWSDIIKARFLNFLEAMSQGAPLLTSDSFDSAAGDIAGVAYQLQGRGEPLVLLPLGLAPSQWDPIVPALRDQYFTVILGGPELGILPLLEHRGRSAGFQRLLRTMLDEIQPEPGATILDVGCGTGAVDRWLATRTAGRNSIVGIDINPYLLREAAGLVRQEGLEQTIRLREGNAEALPFEDNSFDVVISTTVMEEVNAATMLGELVRVTKPGGKIGVIVRALDLPRYTSVQARPELKLRCEAPPRGVSSASGCASADLYRRFQQIGLSDIRRVPDWTVFSDINGTVERALLLGMSANVEPHEAEEWRTAADRAVQEGIFFMTWPHHCAVGTKPG